MTYLIILCHDGSQTVLKNHMPFWKAHDARLIFVSPTDSRVVPEEVEGHECLHIGQQAHCGDKSVAKMKSLLNALFFAPDLSRVAILEYDALFLTKDIPKLLGVFLWNEFVNNDPRFETPHFGHCPWVFSDKGTLRRFVDKLAALPNNAEGGYMDRIFSRALIDGEIPYESLNGYSQNTIKPENYADLEAAVRNGARAIHGCKDDRTLEVAVNALPT